MNVFDLLAAASVRYGPRTAVSDGRRSVTYDELYARASAISRALLSTGREPGARIGILLHNSVEYAELIYAIAGAGMTAVHISYHLKAAEVAYLLENSQAETLVYGADFEELVGELRDLHGYQPSHRDIIVGGQPEIDQVDEYSSLVSANAGSMSPQGLEANPVFYLGYTSGTTGRPKGALITHRSRVLTAMAATIEYGFADGDATLLCTPMHHGGPLVFVLTPLIVGGHLRIMEHFDEEQFAWNVEKFHTSNSFVVPTILSRLTAHESRPLERCEVHLRTLISNAAPLATATKEALYATLPDIKLNEFYGSTEAGIVTNLRPVDQLRKVRCAGQPFFMNHVEILDPQGERVANGDVGRLFSRSPYLFDGYWNLPEATRDAFVRGMVGVGDLARFDEEGYVYIVDRETDMIISGGVNIYPREIEDALLLHPEISEAAVVGQPDAVWGESVVAYVVTRDPDQAVAVVAEAVSSLASYKHPRVVVAVSELPRNSTGKLLKRELRARHWNGDVQI